MVVPECNANKTVKLLAHVGNVQSWDWWWQGAHKNWRESCLNIFLLGKIMESLDYTWMRFRASFRFFSNSSAGSLTSPEFKTLYKKVNFHSKNLLPHHLYSRLCLLYHFYQIFHHRNHRGDYKKTHFTKSYKLLKKT